MAWNDRTKELLSMIPQFFSLLEFGEGNGNTKFHLANIKYTGSDLYQRNPNTIVCDLNQRPLPKFEIHDVILMSGVLEYIYDIEEVINHLSQFTNMFAISYAGSDNHSIDEEMINGWKICLSYADLIKIFKIAGFKLINMKSWKKQRLFVFSKNSNLETWKQLQENEYFKNHRCYQGLHLSKEDNNLINEIKNKTIVEIGCGYGRETYYFSKYAKKVYAIDVSSKILSLMKETVKRNGDLTKVVPVEANQFVNIIQEPLDFIYSQYVFQHISIDLAKDYLDYFRPLLTGKLQILFRVGIRKLFPEGKEPLVEYTFDEIQELLKEYKIIDIKKAETSTYKLWNITAI